MRKCTALVRKCTALIFPAALLLAAMGCGRSSGIKDYTDITTVEPVVFCTSLTDTLPAKTYRAMKVGNVLGIKIRDLQGHDIRYFEYQAEASHLLHCISRMPFNKNYPVADTVCRKISYDELRLAAGNLSATELNSTSFFSTAHESRMEIYECLKSPMKHHILIDKATHKVLHRIEFIG